MKIVIRSGVFETNSSSVHSYTCPIKSERISFKGWARSKADKDKVVNIDFDWWIDETGDVSPDNKLALVLSGIPAFWQNQEDYDRYISYAEVQENETYKEIIRRLELRSGYILNLNYPNEEQSLEYLWIQSLDDKEYFIYWLGDPVIKRHLEEENKKYDSET